MPFLAYVHAADRDPRPERRPWEPDWRVWRWIAAAGFAFYGVTRTEGGVELVLVIAVFSLVCKAIDAALPDWGGMRDYRQ